MGKLEDYVAEYHYYGKQAEWCKWKKMISGGAYLWSAFYAMGGFVTGFTDIHLFSGTMALLGLGAAGIYRRQEGQYKKLEDEAYYTNMNKWMKGE